MSVQLQRKRNRWSAHDSIEELAELARSAGADVVDSIIQKVNKPNQTYLGKGKLEELKQRASVHRASTVICDDELTPTQQRNLENALDGLKVIDRTGLILDVFGKRAHTKEGRLQVELAQHEYLLPRLAGQWSHLERLGGGIGTRGPGETQIETDRRLVRNRIQRLKKNLEQVRRHRSHYRTRRRNERIPIISLVGYTNAGKSTLLNILTDAHVAAQNQLFSTLDPITRKLILPSGLTSLITDTVGFIQKLPPALISAFSATLEELQEANLLLHIVDITHRNAPEQVDAVESVLRNLNLDSKPRLMVYNKADKFIGDTGPPLELNSSKFDSDNPPTLLVSAKSGLGINRLRDQIDSLLSEAYSRSI